MVRKSILVFAAGVLGVLGALGWMTVHALRLERGELEARRDARYQESVRLALWRMDAAVTPIIAREAARPYFHYQPFYVPGRAYSQMLAAALDTETLVPSPLLSDLEEGVRLHYQINPDGTITSPQVPQGRLSELANGAYVTAYSEATASERFASLNAMLLDTKKAAALATDRAAGIQFGSGAPPEDDASRQALQQSEQAPASQVAASEQEYKSRQEAVSSASNVSPSNRQQRAGPVELTEPLAAKTGTPAPGPVVGDMSAPGAAPKREADAESFRDQAAMQDDVLTGPFLPRWISPDGEAAELVFERTITLGGETITQGFWIDWPVLRARLIGSVTDLFPEAKLAPLPFGVEAAPASVLGRTLAAIPAELVTPAPASASIPLLTPVRTTLALTWALALAAVVVIALVLRASMELAERRGQFVTAVTHELRTPLTTFVMYSQMLADGLVRDEESQRSYIGTLKSESTRLARIVESVLDYARLSKRQRPSTVRARLTAEQIVDSLTPVLRNRCDQAGMELIVERESLLDFPVTTDPPTLERIIYNLVDNACKYAASSSDKRIHLIARVERRDLVLAVKDHGPGIDLKERAQVFRAFTRGKAQSDGNISGLGLGLALAQGLARELGGDLRLAPSPVGAEFLLRLPRD